MNRHLLEELAYAAAGTVIALAIILGVESGRTLLDVTFGVIVAAPLVVFLHMVVHAAAAVWLTGKHVFVQMGPDPALLRFSIGRVDFRVSGTHPAVCDLGSPDARPRRLAFTFLAGPFGSLALGAAVCGFAFALSDHASFAFRALVGAGGLALAVGASNLLPLAVPRWWPGSEGRGETDARSGMRLIAAHRRAVASGVRPGRVGPEHIPEAGRQALQRAGERFEAGQMAGARRALTTAASSPDPETAAAAQFDLGLLAANDGNEPEALARYEMALEAGVPGPSSAAAINLAAILERTGRRASAVAALERAAALGHPRWAPFAHTNLGDVLARSGDYEGAAAAYRASLAVPPHEHAARAAFRLGKVLIAQGDERAGRAALAMAAELGDDRYADQARMALRESAERATANA